MGLETSMGARAKARFARQGPAGRVPALEPLQFYAPLVVLFHLLAVAAAAGRPAPRGRCIFDARQSTLRVAKRSFTDAKGHLLEARSTTQICLQCHDGSIASTVPTRAAAAPSELADISNHPVDVPYPLHAPGLVPRSVLDERLVLENGRLTCRTCHGSEASGVGLSIPNDRSRLCLACHIK